MSVGPHSGIATMIKSVYQMNPPQSARQGTLAYEQPLNERMRHFLRLEHLLSQAALGCQPGPPELSRTAIQHILAAMEILKRNDVKSEVLQELNRHSNSLGRLQDYSGIDHARLNAVLDELDAMGKRMEIFDGSLDSSLGRHELLSSIRQRTAIPGGTCAADMPAFHFWLQRSAEHRARDIAGWFKALVPVQEAIELILRLFRTGTVPAAQTAHGGFFQKNLDRNSGCLLVRVELPMNSPYFPEISGGRHRFTIRFMTQEAFEQRAEQTQQDVDFWLSCCSL